MADTYSALAKKEKKDDAAVGRRGQECTHPRPGEKRRRRWSGSGAARGTVHLLRRRPDGRISHHATIIGRTEETGFDEEDEEQGRGTANANPCGDDDDEVADAAGASWK